MATAATISAAPATSREWKDLLVDVLPRQGTQVSFPLGAEQAGEPFVDRAAPAPIFEQDLTAPVRVQEVAPGARPPLRRHELAVVGVADAHEMAGPPALLPVVELRVQVPDGVGDGAPCTKMITFECAFGCSR